MFKELKMWKIDNTDIPTCVSMEELEVLKDISRDLDQDELTAVDLGSGAGATTNAICEGNPDVHVHCFDHFRLGPGSYAPERFRKIQDQPKRSFIKDFIHNTEKWQDRITIYHGDFKKFRWPSDPIHLLHVDLAKTVELWNHMLLDFYPALVEGSVVIHQDFLMPKNRNRLGFIKYGCGRLGEYVKLVARQNWSAYFIVEQVPPEDLLEQVAAECTSLFWDRAESK